MNRAEACWRIVRGHSLTALWLTKDEAKQDQCCASDSAVGRWWPISNYRRIPPELMPWLAPQRI